MGSFYKELWVMLKFLKVSFLVLHFSYYILIAIYADYTTFSSNCDRAYDVLQQLELASELKSDLLDTVNWGRKWIVDFNTKKTQLVWMVLL